MPPGGGRLEPEDRDLPSLPAYDQSTDRAEWWNFERLTQWDTTHPAAAWAASLLQEAALTYLPCPRCGQRATVGTNLNHLLRDHRADYAEAAAWLEDADADLFSLAVHYLASKARATTDSRTNPGRGRTGPTRTEADGDSTATPTRTAQNNSHVLTPPVHQTVVIRKR